MKEIIMDDLKKTISEFWKEFHAIKEGLSPLQRATLLNEHLQHLTRWLYHDGK